MKKKYPVWSFIEKFHAWQIPFLVRKFQVAGLQLY